MGEHVTRGNLPPWQAPEPSQLPEWRGKLREYFGSDIGSAALGQAVENGQTNMIPTLPRSGIRPGAVAGRLLARGERDRLSRAELYYVTADMTSLALAAAEVPPNETVSADRLPSPCGLMLFAEPIGGYRIEPGDVAARSSSGPLQTEITVPIVGVSWGRWTPHDITVPESTEPVQWIRPDHHSNVVDRVPDSYNGIWMTFYSPASAPYDAMAPDTVVSRRPDGTTATAADMSLVDGVVPLMWDNEAVMAIGSDFGTDDPAPDSIGAWVHVVYTAWQLMTQQSNSRLTETEDLARPRAGRKRDVREGITGSGDVRVVRVHSAHRPSPAAAEQDAQASTGRQAPQYTCRWPVRPHRRDQCMHPRAHADGGCTHREIIVPPYIKGPADKPLRTRETVHLWDRHPTGEAS